ncbi:MAG: choline dehydrogenase [Rhodospirillales bacterium]|nr:choline dehydrogenase [Rhodospirillales bacterium]
MEFDTIIVGAGSAGSVLADRLSADARRKVLVLEAGGSDRRFWIQVPLGYGKIFYNPSVNWMYDTEPDPGLGGRSVYWPRGKVLGGSSSINAMVYIRGNPGDFDDWEAAGNPGWGSRGVMPYFRAMEDTQKGADEWRGTGGPLHVADMSGEVGNYCQAFFEAGQQAGLPFNPDFNGASQEGVGYYQITTKDGRRMSAARAFLRPAMRRENLNVETGAHVTRLLFDGRRVTGVEYSQNGRIHKATARREVILSGGAVNSPQVLQLSGIGPGEVLQRHGIGVVLDNPNVGQNLQDHLGINYTYRTSQPTLNERLRPWWGKLMVGAQYILTRRGPLSICINHGGGFFRTRPGLTRPNMQLYFQAISTITSKDDGKRPLLNPDPFPAMSLGLSSCRPTSRGHITIRSDDPFQKPAINPNSFSTDTDVREMLEAVKFLRVLAGQPALGAVIEEELLPGPDCQSDDELIADFRQRCGTVFHPSCTCMMGPDPTTSVVDSRLRVHGIEGLRVVDASIFPNVTTGNTNAPTMMVAARAADLIMEDEKGPAT